MCEQKLSIVFMGTPRFACPSLEKLAEQEKVVAVVTQPDRPVGRGKKIASPPLKVVASKIGIPVYQPRDIKAPAFLKEITFFNPDLIVVVAFGGVLPETIIEIPKILSINLHPSLLPKYRGPAPVAWALIKGETHTGVTIQKIRKEVDRGEIILQKKLAIEPEDSCGTLSIKLSHLGAKMLTQAIKLIKEGKVKLKPQQGRGSYAPKITKQMGKINWGNSAWEIHNLVRGLNPSPGAYAIFFPKDKPCQIKIWKTNLRKDILDRKENTPGTVVKIKKEEGFVVKTAKEALLVKEVQLPGKNRISAYDFIKGYHIQEGFVLGGQN
ncbi:methionyl-tRNA formyltransferase [Candidatus Aerophobetes bacterium]|nr:methionyl-tRNA formyltransferase [Candidatus Aerophobetes bacterium]